MCNMSKGVVLDLDTGRRGATAGSRVSRALSFVFLLSASYGGGYLMKISFTGGYGCYLSSSLKFLFEDSFGSGSLTSFLMWVRWAIFKIV